MALVSLRMHSWGVPVMAQPSRTRLVSMRMRFQSLALLGGLRIQRCHELWCSLQVWLGSGIAVAVAVAGTYTSELPYALGVALKRQKKKKKAFVAFPLWCSGFSPQLHSSGCCRGVGSVLTPVEWVKDSSLWQWWHTLQLELRFKPWPRISMCCECG